MTSQTVQSARGSFEIVLDEEGAIVDVAGDWPASGEEFTLEGAIPDHTTVQAAPERIQATAKDRGWEVCYYDNVHCRTCYCDGQGRMRCVAHC